MIKVLLAEDHKILREGIAAMLKEEENLIIVGEAENGKQAIEKLHEQQVDVLLLDINMPEMDGIEVTKYVRENFADTKVLVLSMLEHEHYVTHMFEAGAMGYLLKSTGKDELLAAIAKVAEGEPYICHKISLNLVKRPQMTIFKGPGGKSIKLDLSRRELEILQLVAEGLTNEEIAEKTFTSKRTVETHRKNMIEKTGTRNTAALIKFAVVNGIIN